MNLRENGERFSFARVFKQRSIFPSGLFTAVIPRYDTIYLGELARKPINDELQDYHSDWLCRVRAPSSLDYTASEEVAAGWLQPQSDCFIVIELRKSSRRFWSGKLGLLIGDTICHEKMVRKSINKISLVVVSCLCSFILRTLDWIRTWKLDDRICVLSELNR